MTTRRRRPAGPPPPRGRSGRFGLPPLAIRSFSVKTPEFGVDSDGLLEDVLEPAPLDRPVEAPDVAAGVRAAAGLRSARHENAVAGRKPDQLTLPTTPAAAGARPQRLRPYDASSESSLGSTGMPAGTSA